MNLLREPGDMANARSYSFRSWSRLGDTRSGDFWNDSFGSVVMPKPTPEEQEAFGTDLDPSDNMPVSTQGMIRPTVISDVGKNIQRRARRQSMLVKTANPFAIDDPSVHRGLVGD